jgi:hypothetical protein
MKLALTQIDSGFVVKVRPREIVSIMALPDRTRLRLENGVEITVRQTAEQIDKLTRKGGK